MGITWVIVHGALLTPSHSASLERPLPHLELVQTFGSGLTAPPAWQQTHAYTVGDFDGDGLDELLTYNGSNGSDVMVFEYNPSATFQGFWNKSEFDRGSLASFEASSGEGSGS